MSSRLKLILCRCPGDLPVMIKLNSVRAHQCPLSLYAPVPLACQITMAAARVFLASLVSFKFNVLQSRGAAQAPATVTAGAQGA